MSRVQGFPPEAAPGARVLILGSMPSVRSLEKRQYYGHPQNRFWKIMGFYFDAGPERPYAERFRRLKQHGVAVWDVMSACDRRGSLDAAIESASIEPNDFRGFLAGQPLLRRVFFNGQQAARTFTKCVAPVLTAAGVDLDCQTLPSTSPANATYSLDELLGHWKAIPDALQ